MKQNRSVDLNCDLGESFGSYTIGMDEQIIPYVTSVNIACGFHAGDPQVMSKTVRLAAECKASIGAHPGYPDLVGFGRRLMQIRAVDAAADVIYQVGALSAFCAKEKVPLHHVKLHGALYNQAAKDLALSKAICKALLAAAPETVFLVLSGSQMEVAARESGMLYACEVFADRAYEEDGSLVPRSNPGAMIEDEEEAIRRVLQMVQKGTVTAISGREIALRADSICVHGDGPKALAFAQHIHLRLEEEHISLSPFAGRRA